MTPRAVRYVQPKVFAKLTGYTEKAVERKRHEGIWREGREYHKAPDGRILIDLEGFESWVAMGVPHGS
ncbi:MAG: excisionase [Pseudomonadota bacterium]